MDDFSSDELKNGLLRGYAYASIEVNLALRPQFISNDPAAGRKVLADLENELRRCDQFAMSVAFVTMGGITPLLQTLKELEERNIPGKILTTDYLTFVVTIIGGVYGFIHSLFWGIMVLAIILAACFGMWHQVIGFAVFMAMSMVIVALLEVLHVFLGGAMENVAVRLTA